MGVGSIIHDRPFSSSRSKCSCTLRTQTTLFLLCLPPLQPLTQQRPELLKVEAEELVLCLSAE
eukprot:4470885-Prorocentrum_lima.AAC.1